MDKAVQVIKRQFEKEAEYLTLQLSCVRDWANANSLEPLAKVPNEVAI